jgi:hypothetical protein
MCMSMKAGAAWIGIFLLSPLLLRASAELKAPCGASPRIIGAFGAENSAPPAISVSDAIGSQLPGLVVIRQILNSQLSPSGEEIVVYDSAEGESDPHPKVAFVVEGKVRLILDISQLTDWGGGFERFQAACQFDLGPDRKAVALAFTTAFDGTGSTFDIVMWQGGTFKILFSTHGIQGRLMIEPGRLSLWSSEGKGECVWCGQRYKTTQFVWRGSRFRKSTTGKPKGLFDPSEISGQPLNFRDRPGSAAPN